MQPLHLLGQSFEVSTLRMRVSVGYQLEHSKVIFLHIHASGHSFLLFHFQHNRTSQPLLLHFYYVSPKSVLLACHLAF